MEKRLECSASGPSAPFKVYLRASALICGSHSLRSLRLRTLVTASAAQSYPHHPWSHSRENSLRNSSLEREKDPPGPKIGRLIRLIRLIQLIRLIRPITFAADSFNVPHARDADRDSQHGTRNT